MSAPVTLGSVSESGFLHALNAAPIGLFITDDQGRGVYANERLQAICGFTKEESLGEGWARFVHPDDRERVGVEWTMAVREEREFTGEYRVRPPFAPETPVQWIRVRTRPLWSPEGLRLGHVGVVEDINERKLAENSVNAARDRATDLLRVRVEILTRIAAGSTFAQPLRTTLDALARNIVDINEAVACSLRLTDEHGMGFRSIGSAGLPEAFGPALEAAVRSGADLWVLRSVLERTSIVMRDVRHTLLADVRCQPLHDLMRNAAWDVVVCQPLIYRQRVLGTLSCYYVAGTEPGDDEIAFLRTVADQAAVAVENAHLFTEAQDKAALEERQKLARELHDSVSQVLYAIGFSASAIRERLSTDPLLALGFADQVLALVGTGIAEMHALIFELRPESLAEQGLVAALEKHVAILRARHGLVIEAVLGEEPDALLELKEIIYRVGQEALTNAARHASASLVIVHLHASADTLSLEVSDDGVGFDPAMFYPGHLGLRSMRERLQRLSGTLEIDSAPGRGARIRAELPIPF